MPFSSSICRPGKAVDWSVGRRSMVSRLAGGLALVSLRWHRSSYIVDELLNGCRLTVTDSDCKHGQSGILLTIGYVRATKKVPRCLKARSTTYMRCTECRRQRGVFEWRLTAEIRHTNTNGCPIEVRSCGALLIYSPSQGGGTLDYFTVVQRIRSTHVII